MPLSNLTNGQVIVEFSESQQAFHLNHINNGLPETVPNTYGYFVVLVCESRQEALELTKKLREVLPFGIENVWFYIVEMNAHNLTFSKN